MIPSPKPWATVIHAQRELEPGGKNRDPKFRKYYVRIFPTPGGTTIMTTYSNAFFFFTVFHL